MVNKRRRKKALKKFFDGGKLTNKERTYAITQMMKFNSKAVTNVINALNKFQRIMGEIGLKLIEGNGIKPKGLFSAVEVGEENVHR